MINKDAWLAELLAKLRSGFGDRLLFLGIQGSCRRGEQTDASDFDAVVILDRLDMADLAAYRAIVNSMPHPEKACGFISGKAELMAWPKHELFQFVRDTTPLAGDLAALTPEITKEDIREAVKTGASGIYHFACHTFVHNTDADARMEILRGLYKGAYFVLVQAHFLRTGVYAGTRKSLTESLSGPERRIMETGNDWDASKPERDADPDAYFKLIIEWSGSLMLLGAR